MCNETMPLGYPESKTDAIYISRQSARGMAVFRPFFLLGGSGNVLVTARAGGQGMFLVLCYTSIEGLTEPIPLGSGRSKAGGDSSKTLPHGRGSDRTNPSFES